MGSRDISGSNSIIEYYNKIMQSEYNKKNKKIKKYNLGDNYQ